MKNQICHFEIGCRDRDKIGDFYSKMFEWTLQREPATTMLRTGGDVGGHLNSLGHEPHNYTIFYVMVDNVARALEKAASLGGKQLVGPIPLPNSTEFGWFSDPEGNTIGVYAEAPQAGRP